MNGDVKHEEAHEGVNGMSVKPTAGVANGRTTGTNHALPNGVHEPALPSIQLANGVATSASGDAAAMKLLKGLKDMPPEIEHVAREFFVSLGTLIGRSAQDCWTTLARKVERLSSMPVPPQPQPQPLGMSVAKVLPHGLLPNNTKTNQDKKDELLNFASDQKAIFIKLLVLLHWSKDVDDVSKVIDLNRWLRDRVSHYGEASNFFAQMKRYLAFIQTPNPNLKTAAEILSQQRVSGFSSLGYSELKPISNKQALKTLRSLNSLLCSRLTLHEDLPYQLRQYCVHDGRVTFYVQDEFELDVSVLEETFESQLYLADFRFAFLPSSDVPTGRLFDELSFTANDLLAKKGLRGCYQFLHEFALSYKINVLHKQALELLQGQWSENLKVELIHRTLVVQYWTNRQGVKSWIEIGIKSGRGKNEDDQHDEKRTFLCIRWMQASKEVEETKIDLDVQDLSMDSILREVIAQHTNRVFDAVFDSLSSVPVYAGGDLLLEQSASATEPSECDIEVQLSQSKSIKVTLEAVTGAVVLAPTSGVCNHVELELNRAKNLVEELPNKLSYLRCIVAEEDLIALAEAAGWTVLRSFRPSANESKALFPAEIIKSCFLRCNFWEPGHMVAATHGPQGDQWWLVQQDQPGASQAQWKSQLLKTKSRHAEATLSHAYMRQLAEYTSGIIVLQQSAAHLGSMSIRCKLRVMPQFQGGVELPTVSLDFQPIKLRSVLGLDAMATDWEPDNLQLAKNAQGKEKVWIRNVLAIRYAGIDSDSNGVTLIANGGTDADEKTLRYLAKSIDSREITFEPNDGKFSIRCKALVGRPAVEDLLRRILHLEDIIACVGVIESLPSTTITSLSLSSISLRYRSAPPTDLGLAITFAKASRPLDLSLMPIGQNPHARISKHLAKLLSHHLSTSVMSLLPLLSLTYPLLSLFEELQSQQNPEHNGGAIDEDMLKLIPRIHIMPRHATMYGVQFYAPAGFTAPTPSGPHHVTGMLARFEILPHVRNGRNKWILRAAIEEFEAYSQPSYCDQSLKDKITQEIFRAEQPDGWITLDSGAGCDVENPGPLLQAVIDVVASWMKDFSNVGSVNGTPNGHQHPVQQASNPVTNGVQVAQQVKAKNNAKKVRQKQGHEVITLDD